MRVVNVRKEFITKREKIIAVDGISYSFEKGKFYAIMGPSGSGKSTFLKMLGLVEKIDSGDYYLSDKNIANCSENELADIRMKNIGFIFQDYFLDIHLKAYENVILPMYANLNIPRKDRRKLADKLLKSVDMLDRANHYPKELSGGEQQRIAIARALANDPDYILADEPTGNLDDKNAKIVFTLLKKLTKEGKCVIVVSHSQEVADYADEVINIRNGSIK